MSATSRFAGPVRAALAGAAVALALVLGGGAAHAYPQFQLSTGATRCSLCHIAPAGGGLLNDYGRSESSDDISEFGGNGAFLYGAYKEPDWIKLGVNLRAALLTRDQSSDPEYYAFPMQGDTYVWLRREALSLYAVLGPRAQVRGPERSFVDRFGSREYWVMWRPKTKGWYARAGRFFAPFGLRSQDHTLYVRRDLDQGNWQETYNLSAGKVENQWEVHTTLFAPVPYALQGNGVRRYGGAAYGEKRILDNHALVGAQVKAGFGDVDRQYLAGGLGKYYFEDADVLLMGELDLSLQDFDHGPTRPQLVGYLGATWWPIQGLMLGSAIQRYDEDLTVRRTARDAIEATVQYFPLAHWEIMLLGRAEAQSNNYGDAGTMAMLQLHYYL